MSRYTIATEPYEFEGGPRTHHAADHRLYPIVAEPIIDKPEKGGFYATNRNYKHDSVLVGVVSCS